MMFVYGFRCKEHAFQKMPDESSIGSHMTITMGRLIADYDKQKAEILEKRCSEGISPLFWVKKNSP